MPAATLLVAAAANLVSGVAFLYVAWRLRSRPASASARGAVVSFSLWWAGAGAYSVALAGLTTSAALGLVSVPVFLAVRLASLLVIMIACAALVHALRYLLTGRSRIAPIAGAYAAVYALTLYSILSAYPLDVRVDAWGADLDYPPSWTAAPLAAATLGPPLVAAVAYLRLGRTLEDATLRYRASLIGGSLALWIASVLLARVASSDLAQLVTRPALGLAVGVAIVAAYEPPAWARRRFGLRALAEETAPPPASGEREEAPTPSGAVAFVRVDDAPVEPPHLERPRER